MTEWLTHRRNAFAALLAVTIGCNQGPSRIATPDVDPAAAAQQAIEQFDDNGDGRLSGDELAACPALAAALASYDTSGDEALSQEEIVAGIGRWADRGVGAMALPFNVRLDGRPLAGAEVKLVPAPFLEGAIEPASGTADSAGSGALSVPADSRPANVPKHLPVVQPGLYRVEITHPTIDVPAKYNTSTTLGVETSSASQNPAGVSWSLQSK